MRILVFLSVVLWSGVASAGTELLLVEKQGCVWCLRWHQEIAPAYPQTTEGRAAPLRRYDLADPLPEDIRLSRRAVMTPTFVLLRDGQEVGRLEGYAGDQFFWYLLDEMLKDAGVDADPAS